MKRLYLNLVLLAVLAGLGVAIWLAQEEKEKGPPLTALSQDQVTHISIAHPDQPAIELEKIEGQWRLVSPVKAIADKYEVNGILALATLEIGKQLDGATNLSELGLEPPKYSVTLDDVRIDLGGTEPIKFRRYVSTGGKVGLVPDPPSAALDADYSDLVAKQIVPEGREITRISLPALTLEKADGGAWKAAEAPDAKASDLSALAESWRTAKAMWNAAEPAEGSSGDAITLVLDDGEQIDLVVAARDPQLILSRPALGMRYTLSKALTETLLQLPAQAPEADGESLAEEAPEAETQQ